MPGADTGRARLLVMDDDRDMCDLLALRLSSSLEVVSAPDGERGILVAQAYRPSVILIDLFMPRLSGLSVLRYLRHQVRFHGVPAVLMTAHRKNLADPGAIEGIADAVVYKPFQLPALEEVLRGLLERSGAVTTEDDGALPEPARRRGPRVALRLPARLRVGGESVDGAIGCLSPMGAQFESRVPIDADEGQLSFAIDDVPLRLPAAVLYRSERQGTAQTGLRFRTVTLEEEFLLWRHVEGLEAMAQRQRLSSALVEHFRARGLTVLRATVGAMEEPRRIRRYAPDVLAYDEERELICFGVSLPGFVLAEPRSRAVIEELAGEEMADGLSRGRPMPVTLAVPAEWATVARRLVSGLGLQAAVRTSIQIIEIPSA